MICLTLVLETQSAFVLNNPHPASQDKEDPMKGTYAHNVADTLVSAEVVVQHILNHFKPKREDGSDCTGGYFVLADADTGLPLTGMFIGDVPDDARAEKYVKLAHEKASRLALMMKADRHVTSWQSRDPKTGQWGGAIYIRRCNRILSFSGLPEHWDEAAMLMVAYLRFNVLASDLYVMAKISNNSQFHELTLNFGVKP